MKAKFLISVFAALLLAASVMCTSCGGGDDEVYNYVPEPQPVVKPDDTATKPDGNQTPDPSGGTQQGGTDNTDMYAGLVFFEPFFGPDTASVFSYMNKYQSALPDTTHAITPFVSGDYSEYGALTVSYLSDNVYSDKFLSAVHYSFMNRKTILNDIVNRYDANMFITILAVHYSVFKSKEHPYPCDGTFIEYVLKETEKRLGIKLTLTPDDPSGSTPGSSYEKKTYSGETVFDGIKVDIFCDSSFSKGIGESFSIFFTLEY